MVIIHLGFTDILNYLLDKDVDFGAKDGDQCTPLHIAALQGHVGFLQRAFEALRNSEALFSSQNIAEKAQKLVGDAAIIAALKSPDEDGNILIHYAKNIQVLNFLLSTAMNLKCGNLVRFKRRDGDTPLHYACEKGGLTNVCITCNKDCEHENALSICSACTRASCEHDEMKYCMECITELDRKEKKCEHKKIKLPLMVKSLLYHGADVNAINKSRETPIMFAAKHNYIEIIEVLLSHGGNVNEKDDDNYTALLVAARLIKIAFI